MPAKNNEDNIQLLQMHADVCKAIAHPTRLAILGKLRDGELTVTAMAEMLGIPKGNLAQHLALLRQRQVVATRREGVNVYYRLVDPKIVQACDLMRSVLLNQLKTSEKLSKKYASG